MKFMNDYIIWDTKSLDYTMERFHKRNRVSGLIKFEFLPLLKQRTKQGRILGWSAIQLAEPDTVVNHCSYSLFPFAPFSSHFGTVHIAHVQGLVVWSLDLFVWRHLAQMCHDVAILGTVEKRIKLEIIQNDKKTIVMHWSIVLLCVGGGEISSTTGTKNNERSNGNHAIL